MQCPDAWWTENIRNWLKAKCVKTMFYPLHHLSLVFFFSSNINTHRTKKIWFAYCIVIPQWFFNQCPKYGRLQKKVENQSINIGTQKLTHRSWAKYKKFKFPFTLNEDVNITWFRWFTDKQSQIRSWHKVIRQS